MTSLLLTSYDPRVQGGGALHSLLSAACGILIVVLNITAYTRVMNFPVNDVMTNTNLINLAVSLTTRRDTDGLFDNVIVLLSGPFSVNS